MAKKKRKQYVAHVSKQRSAKAALKDLAIAFAANLDHLELVNVKKCRIESAGPSINAAMEKIRYKWTVYLCAMGRSKLGQAYVKIEEMRVPHEVFKHEISHIASQYHDKLTGTIPENQLSNVGWLATPNDSDLSEKEIEGLFNLLGCWENLAPWQRELLGEG